MICSLKSTLIVVLAATGCMTRIGGDSVHEGLPTVQPVGEEVYAIPSSTDSQHPAENVAVSFYRWYLDGLRIPASYQSVQPGYVIVDTTAVLQTTAYFDGLREMGLVSERFLLSEVARFNICQSGLNQLAYALLEECGCTPDNFVSECAFIDDYHWIQSDEKYDGAWVADSLVREHEAQVTLHFYFEYENRERVADPSFTAVVQLSMYEGSWLIDSIRPLRNTSDN